MEHNPWGNQQNQQNLYGSPPANDPWGQQPQTNQNVVPPPVLRSAPPPPSRQISLPHAQGMWAFAAENSNELSFNAGDVIEIVEQNGDWWKGRFNGKEGLFPANYVKLL